MFSGQCETWDASGHAGCRLRGGSHRGMPGPTMRRAVDVDGLPRRTLLHVDMGTKCHVAERSAAAVRAGQASAQKRAKQRVPDGRAAVPPRPVRACGVRCSASYGERVGVRGLRDTCSLHAGDLARSLPLTPTLSPCVGAGLVRELRTGRGKKKRVALRWTTGPILTTATAATPPPTPAASRATAARANRRCGLRARLSGLRQRFPPARAQSRHPAR